jgi:hypothetical protein
MAIIANIRETKGHEKQSRNRTNRPAGLKTAGRMIIHGVPYRTLSIVTEQKLIVYGPSRV